MFYLRIRRNGAIILSVILGLLLGVKAGTARAQSNSGIVQGTVSDPSKGAVPGAKVELQNPVSGHVSEAETGVDGSFRIANIPFNPYHLTVTAPGFTSFTQDVDVRSTVPISLNITLKIGESSTTVTVTENATDLLEVEPTEHTDIDRQLFDTLPLESVSSSVSSLITLSSPGVVADSNGLFHGLGDHAENSFSVDGQPITDQQSKVFSNQIPSDSIQSMEVIEGAPPAEYGDKTSLVVKVTTRSGLGISTPTGSVTTSYGSFGTPTLGFDLAYGTQKWGNFISASGLETGRFLDGPELTVMHDKGNEENIFDRVDYKLSSKDTIQLNLGYTRSWFQTPNSFDNLNIGVLNPLNGLPVGPTDQRSQISTFNIAPTWTRLINNYAVFTLGTFIRQDQYNYYPSADPFADLGPPNLQRETIGQNRKLANVGVRSDLSYVKGAHNIKIGVTYQQTFLDEADSLGIVDPTLNAPCLDASGNPVSGFNNPSQCAGAGDQPNIASNPHASSPFIPLLGCYDLTRPIPSAADACPSSSSGQFLFQGHTDVKELGLYVQDAITTGNWTFNIGIRGDIYNGLTAAQQAEPRVGIAYKVKPSNTVLRISYARSLESPFNENLILSSTGCNYEVIADLVPCVPSSLSPGYRNEFHAGLQQAFGRFFVLDGEYIWKYTHNAYDFSVLGNTPITFPIEWRNSKIPGFSVRGSMPNLHGLSAFVVLSHVSARFFTPQVGGLGVVPLTCDGCAFRIDHDENFEQTTHLQYQPRKNLPWIGFNWRYDSGLVAGPVPCAGGNCANGPLGSATVVDASILTPDQQFEAGLFCGSVHATPTTPISPNSLCPASEYGSTLLKIPAPGTENDDTNPPRIAPRSLFDLSLGDDDLFHRSDRYKWSLRFTVINLTNKVALYNFLSTFSGTHYVSPRTETAELGFHF